MHENKREPKLLFCKKVRLNLHLEMGISIVHEPGEALARLRHGSAQWAAHSFGLSQLPWSQAMHLNSNSWETAGTNPNFLQLRENIFRSPVVFTEHSMDQFLIHPIFQTNCNSPVTFRLLTVLVSLN